MSEALLLQVLSEISEVKSELGTVQGQNVLILGEQHAASESRKGIHEKLAALHGDHMGLGHRVAMLEGTMAGLVPKVDALIDERRDRHAVRNFFRSKYTLGAGLVGGGVAGWHQWEKIAGWASKAFK